MSVSFDIIVIGGGFFGASIALHYKKMGARVVIVERAPRLLQRASLNNQARVHGGYHYPRSLLTGIRSRVNYQRFIDEYRECIVDDFTHYYAVSKRFSKVTAAQFRLFCERIKAPLALAPNEIRRCFSADHVDGIFEVPECAFNAERLAAMMTEKLDEVKCGVLCGHEALRISPGLSGRLDVFVQEGEPSAFSQLGHSGEVRSLSAKKVFLCTYSHLNHFLKASNLPLLPLRQEYTEMALVEPPLPFKKSAVTVMCGPFFSLMPFPSRQLHSFSHVRYTPHLSWSEGADEPNLPRIPYEGVKRRSHFTQMVHDAARFLPMLAECQYVDSLWETKTILPRNDDDDARPILFQSDYGIKGLTCVLGGKIDNVFDIVEEISAPTARLAMQ